MGSVIPRKAAAAEAAADRCRNERREKWGMGPSGRECISVQCGAGTPFDFAQGRLCPLLLILILMDSRTQHRKKSKAGTKSKAAGRSARST
jgi:hypothetical protein